MNHISCLSCRLRHSAHADCGGKPNAIRRNDVLNHSKMLWEHEAERSRRRAANHRSSTEKVALRREIAAIVQSAKPSRRQLRNAVRNAHAAAAEKPYGVMQPPTPPPAEHPPRQKSRLPVEDW